MDAYRPCGPGILNNALVPQGFAGVDQRDACWQHDRCYESPCASRLQCDQQFRDNMLCNCECSPHPQLCRMRAWMWYGEVRLWGRSAYRSAQRSPACCCESCQELGCEEAVILSPGN